jgi:hypothetical protein
MVWWASPIRKHSYASTPLIRHTMAIEMRSGAAPEAEINGLIGHRAYGGKAEIYAKYRPDYLGQAVAVIDGYTDVLRASCVLEPGCLPERKSRKKKP